MHLRDSAGSSQWDSHAAWQCYRSLKVSIEADLARMISFGHPLESDTSTAEEGIAGAINIPEQFIPCIENICDSFCPGLQHALREYSENQSHFDRNRKMDKGHAARAQGSREDLDNKEDSLSLEHQTEGQSEQPALETLKAAETEPLVQQKLLVQLESGDRSAPDSDAPNENMSRGRTLRVSSNP